MLRGAGQLELAEGVPGHPLLCVGHEDALVGPRVVPRHLLQLLLDARRLSFVHADAGRGTLELERAAVRDCKAAKGESTLVQVVAEGGAAGGLEIASGTPEQMLKVQVTFFWSEFSNLIMKTPVVYVQLK